LEGERKQVTVLFADLKGSMELLADRDPEEARKILDPVLAHMMEAVHRYEGTVNQVMGDGIMALFGAPLAHEDHAVRACYAALRMHETVRRHAEGVRRSEGLLVQIRVGLNSGEVVVRSIGSDLHMDYTAVGQTTHLAARMEQMAIPGSVLVTGDTLRLAEGYVQVKSLGPIPVKGLPDPIEVSELTGAGTARTRLQAAVLRGLTRFVGRDAEVEHLRRVLGQAGAGRGQVVAIVGEAGVGKSTLTAMEILGLRSLFITFLAEASLVVGRIAEAREQAEQAVALARGGQERGSEAWGLKLLGDIHAHEPAEAEQAGDTYRQALALAIELSMRPLVAHCHLGLGALARRTGRGEQAQEHLTTATTLYREMNMQFWLEKAEAEVTA